MNGAVLAVASLADLLWAITHAMFTAAAMVAAVGLWAFMIWGSGRLFKQWRLYSPHPWAKRLRKHLRARREMKAARA